jgi:hypothetical protein
MPRKRVALNPEFSDAIVGVNGIDAWVEPRVESIHDGKEIDV